jgi:DNA-binding response OmpR family regulator
VNENVTILVVDDDPDVLFATARVIQKAGYRVIKASSGEEGLQKIKAHGPDLILLDVVLPDMEGGELCRKIKEDPALRKTFVILISGTRTSSDEQVVGLDEGADGYIARPISNRELLARVNALVRILMVERERDRLIAGIKGSACKDKDLERHAPHLCTLQKDKGRQGVLERG